MRRVLFLAPLACLALLPAKAQDPVKVAGDIYKVIVEYSRRGKDGDALASRLGSYRT